MVEIPEGYETYHQAAERTGYPYTIIRRRAVAGEIPIFLPPGRKNPKLVKRADVDAVLQIRPQKPTHEQTIG